MLTVKTTLSTASNDPICVWICGSWQDDWEYISLWNLKEGNGCCFHCHGIVLAAIFWRQSTKQRELTRAFCRSGSLGVTLTIHFSGAWPDVVLPRTLSRSHGSSSDTHIQPTLLDVRNYSGMSCPQVNPPYPRRGTSCADRNQFW